MTYTKPQINGLTDALAAIQGTTMKSQSSVDLAQTGHQTITAYEADE